MEREHGEQSLMEATGLGLLPGLTGALALVVVAMAALLTGSMWAVVGVLVLIGLCLAAILLVMVAVTSEGEDADRLRGRIPGLGERTSSES